MRIEEIDIRTMLGRLAQAHPELKDEIKSIDQAKETYTNQMRRTQKPEQPFHIERSENLVFYEAVENDMVTAYHITDIRLEDVTTTLRALLHGMRKIRPIVLLLAIPQEGFSVSEETIRRIEESAILCHKINAPRGRGLEIYMGIYQQQISEKLLRWEFF